MRAGLRAIFALLFFCLISPAVIYADEIVHGILRKVHMTAETDGSCSMTHMLEELLDDGSSSTRLLQVDSEEDWIDELIGTSITARVERNGARLRLLSVEGVSAQAVVHENLPAAIGEQSTLVVLIHFPDATIDPAYGDRSEINITMFSPIQQHAVNHMYYVGSSGLTWLSGNTVGPYVIPRTSSADPSNRCNTAYFRDAALAAAQAAGVNTANYRRRVIVLPHTVSCGWAGLAEVGARSFSTAWIRFASERVLAHEFGHNLGMHHSLTSSGGEDGSTVMGSSCQSHAGPNGLHKHAIGWTPGQETLTVNRSGAYSLQGITFHGFRQSAPQILRFYRGPGPSDFLYASYRARNGEDMTLTTPHESSIQLHTLNQTNGSPILLSSLGTGQSYQDPVSAVRITYASRDLQLAQLQVTMPASSNLTVTATTSTATGPLADVEFYAEALGPVQLTDSQGRATFSGLKPGVAYRITPRKAGYIFAPASVEATLSSAALHTFTATPTASGELRGVVLLNGRGVENVRIYAGDLAAPVMTDQNGEFRLGQFSAGTRYSLTPIALGLRFLEETLVGTIQADTPPLILHAAQRTFTISGRVSRRGMPGDGITVGFSRFLGHGDIPSELEIERRETVTDALGYYRFENVPESGHIGVAPRFTSGLGQPYAPISYPSVVNEDLTANFEVTAENRSVSGTTVNSTGAPLSGVILSSGLMGEVQSGSDGRFLFSNGPSGISVTVVPRKRGMLFEPPRLSFTVTNSTDWLRFVGRANTCQADFNDDGTATIADISEYLGLWLSLSEITERDGTSGITNQDLLQFIQAWFEGCG